MKILSSTFTHLNLSKLTFDLFTLILIRITIFIFMLKILGYDPNNDSALFNNLANENLGKHFSGDGENYQFPLLSPLVFKSLKLIMGTDYWLRLSFLFFDCLIYILFHLFLKQFRGHILSKLYISGFFTAPVVAIWAQDEIIAVLPFLLLHLFELNIIITHLLILLSFLFLKNFYIFFPISYLSTREERRTLVFILLCTSLMYFAERSGQFVPSNTFTTSIWFFTDLKYPTQKHYSLLLVLSLVIFFLWKMREIEHWRKKSLIIMSIFLLFFYHVNFEYYLFITLPAIVMYLNGDMTFKTLIVGLTWYISALASNVFFALAYTVFQIFVFEVFHAASIIIASIIGAYFIMTLVNDTLQS